MPSPITSRVKRHPSFGPLKSDKDPKDPKAETFTGDKTEIKEVKETVKGAEKKKTRTYEDMRKDGATEAEIQAAKDANMETYGTHNPTAEGLADNTVGTGEFEPDKEIIKKKEVKTPGSRGDVYTETESRVLQPWEIRRLNRSGRIADNRISSSSRRLSKLGATQDADGNWSLPEGANAKQTRKFNKFKSKFERNSMQKTNVDRSVKSGRGAGELIHSGQRKTTQSEINKDPGSVKAQEKLNADRTAYEESQKAQQNAVTNSVSSSTKPKAESIDPNQANPFTDMLKKFEEDKQKGDYTFGKFNVGAGTSPKSSGLFAKKGAMKKGYFKGN